MSKVIAYLTILHVCAWCPRLNAVAGVVGRILGCKVSHGICRQHLTEMERTV